jgi:hypothetical protein
MAVNPSAYAAGNVVALTPTGTAADAARINAAIARLPAAGGQVILGGGTWNLNATIGPLATGQWITCQPGVLINWLGTGDCFRLADTSVYTARTIQGGGITGRPIIDGTSSGAGSCAVHAGDILQLRLDVAVQNFTGAGDIGVHFDNQSYWTEQAVASIWVNACTRDVVFDCSGAVTSQGSYDRGDFTIYVQHTTFTGDSVVFQNGAYLVGGRLRIFGNYASSSSPFTAAVLKLTGSAPGGHPVSVSNMAQCELDINVESDGGLANTFQTVNFGSSSNTILSCGGNVSYGPGSQFTASNITTLSSQFTFGLAAVTGDNTLNEATLTGRLAVPSQAFFFSSVFVGEIGSAPATPTSGGYLYVDATGRLHYLDPAGTDTVLAA